MRNVSTKPENIHFAGVCEGPRSNMVDEDVACPSPWRQVQNSPSVEQLREGISSIFVAYGVNIIF